MVLGLLTADNSTATAGPHKAGILALGLWKLKAPHSTCTTSGDWKSVLGVASWNLNRYGFPSYLREAEILCRLGPGSCKGSPFFLESLTWLEVCIQLGLMASKQLELPILPGGPHEAGCLHPAWPLGLSTARAPLRHPTWMDFTGLEVCIQHGLVASQQLRLTILPGGSHGAGSLNPAWPRGLSRAMASLPGGPHGAGSLHPAWPRGLSRAMASLPGGPHGAGSLCPAWASWPLKSYGFPTWKTSKGWKSISSLASWPLKRYGFPTWRTSRGWKSISNMASWPLKRYGFPTWRISRGWKSVPGLSLVASKQPRLLFGLLWRCLAAYSTAASRNGLKSWLSTWKNVRLFLNFFQS